MKVRKAFFELPRVYFYFVKNKLCVGSAERPAFWVGSGQTTCNGSCLRLLVAPSPAVRKAFFKPSLFLVP
nr:hypothetical protein [uncultured Treponema sp.]